jgi:Ca2+-binding RTX toxin-like protein
MVPSRSLPLNSAIATSGQLILTFSEGIQIAGGGDLNPAYINVTIDGQTRKITTALVTGSTLILPGLTLLDRASYIGISIDPPSDGSNQGFIADLSENPLKSIAVETIDTFSTGSNIRNTGIGTAYKNLILADSAPIAGYGNRQDNTITGNDASNMIDGLAGSDTMIGGLGDDTYMVDNAGDAIIELASAGTDTVRTTITYALPENLEAMVLLGSAAINATGNTGNNVLRGNIGANVLHGNGGIDALIGGRGGDTYIVDSTGDIIDEGISTREVDSVQSSVSWILGANLENLTLTGANAIDGTGNTLNNTISGNNANNVLDGGSGGIDRLTGLGGADTFRFSTRPSRFSNWSADHITDFSSAEKDKIQINKSAFGVTASKTYLSIVSRSNALSNALSTSSTFVYDPNSGELYWNENGATRGAGNGGILAILDSKAFLSAGDLVLV